MPRIRLAPQLSEITLDHVLSGETCEPISLADFEAYLTYKEHTPENLRFVVWYQDYRRRFFALPLDIQRLSPGPAAHDFDFALPTPARIARRVGRGGSPFAEDGGHLVDGSVAGEPLSPVSSIRTQGAPDDAWSGAPLTPMSTAPLLREPGAFTPSPSRTRRPGSSRPRSLFLSPSSAASNASTSRSPSAPTTPLTAPSLPSPCLVPCAPALQPFRREVSAVAATFLLPAAPQEICLPALLRTRVLLDVARNTHPDVLLPVYEAAYDALRGTSLPTFLREQETNMGMEKRLYWWAYGALTSLVGWAIVCGCVLGADVRREWRLWAVPFLCLGGMQMYAGYRGFCTQIWGRGGMQLHPWELAHPAHLTLVKHDADGEDVGLVDHGKRNRAPSITSNFSDEDYAVQGKDKCRMEVIEIQCLDNDNDLLANIEAPPFPAEDTRHDRLDHHPKYSDHEPSPPFIPPFSRSASLANPSTDTPALSRSPARALKRIDINPAAAALPPQLSPLRFSMTPLDIFPPPDAYRDEWDEPCAWANEPPPSPAAPFLAVPEPAPAPSRASNRAPEFAADAEQRPHRQQPAPHFGAAEDGKRTGSGRTCAWWRARDSGRGKTRGVANTSTDKVGTAGPPLSARARVFGPERIVLDPRIRAVHRRVMRDILVVGFVYGVAVTVVVLVLPHRH